MANPTVACVRGVGMTSLRPFAEDVRHRSFAGIAVHLLEGTRVKEPSISTLSGQS